MFQIPRVNAVRGALLALCVAGAGLTTTAQAQTSTYPDRPIQLLIPFNAGSGSDGAARKLTAIIGADTGWNFVIENKPGANGFIAARDAANAKPDGYTLFYSGNTTHGANSAFFKELPYDPINDFQPITRIGVFPLFLLTRPDLGTDSVAELVELLGQSDPPLTFAEGSAGPRVAAERFLQDANVEATHVPYKSSPQALTDLIGGHIDFMFLDTIASRSMVENGTLKPLAITSAERIDSFPDIPTMQEAGFEGFDVQNWSAFFAPAGTPEDVVEVLHTAFANAIESEEWQAFVTKLGAYADVLTPEETAAWVESEIEQYKRVLARAGVEPE